MQIYTQVVGELEVNCYIVEEAGACVVIDPGAEANRLIAFLEKKGLCPSHILLTHGHFDHIGGVNPLQKKFRCSLSIGVGDAPLLVDPNSSMGAMSGRPVSEFLMSPDQLLQDGEIVQVGALSFEVLETPGHTPGGVTYRCGDALFTGDTLFAGSVGRTDFPGGNPVALMRSVKRLAALEGDFKVLPGHGPASSLSWERSHNFFMRAGSYADLS